MKITHLSTAVLESNFDWTIVKIETDEKITGFGEAFLGPGLTAVILEFAAILIGEDPTSIDRLLRRMHASTVDASPGLVFHGINGIETALLDPSARNSSSPSGRFWAANTATMCGSTPTATPARRSK